MGLSFFLARRFYGGKRRGRRSQASAPAIRIATLGVALGLAVMIVSVCVVRGFKGEISAKITGFGSHVEIFNIKSGRQPEAYPVDVRGLTERVAAVEGVAHVQRTSFKPGVLKTDANFQGVTLKGIGADYDPAFVRRHLVAGRLPRFGEEADANKIVISKLQADKLGLKVGDKTTFSLEPDAAFGVPSPDLIQYFSRREFMDAGEPEIGAIMLFTAMDGSEMPGVIREINGDSITVDFNHPLAGQTVHFDIEVLEIDPALEA